MVFIVKAIFFDLFFTLINPIYRDKESEYDILGITLEEWQHYTENNLIYEERALGKIKTEEEVIEKMITTIPKHITKNITKEQKAKLLNARLNRTKAALFYPEEEIVYTLKEIRKKNIKIGLISNADVIDRKYWQESILASFFDDAIFSCDVELSKPNKEIYELAMKRIEVAPEECLFVGDGGDNELFGAKQVGMKTILTEFIKVREDELRNKLLPYADYQIKHFSDILKFI